MTEAAETLVVAFNFPPFNDGSAVTMAKRTIEADQKVDVIAADLTSVRNRDDSLFDLIAPWVDRVKYTRTPVQFATEVGMRSFVDAGISAHRAMGRRTYKEMFSRSMWAHSHFLAAELKGRGVSNTWTAEFSDPLLWQADGSARHSGAIDDPSFMAHALKEMGTREQRLLRENNSVLYWAQMIPCILADKLLFTNDQQFELMLHDAPQFLRGAIEEKAIISPHPTLPSQYYERPSGGTAAGTFAGPSRANFAKDTTERFRIGYFGTFYPNRGAGEFLEALSSLTPSEREAVCLEVHSDGAENLVQVANRLHLGSCVRVLPPLPYREFLYATGNYDALLVNDIATTPFGTPSPFLPSKYSDYAGSTAGIMAIVIPGSPLDARSVNWKAHVGATDGVVAMLRGAIASRRLPSRTEAVEHP